MNRITRITAILIHLQSKKVVTAKEIAQRFEVSLRTVYRDIKILQESGVPIGSENGTGYFIAGGYTLPPLMITEEEANALLISEQLILHQGDLSLRKDFNSLLIKIKAILRRFEKDKTAKLENRIAPSQVTAIPISHSLPTIQKAITNAAVVRINYHSLYKDEVTQREIEPLGLYFTHKAWVIVAYCRLRNDLREFRLDRILSSSISPEYFDFREGFSLTKYFSELTEHS